MNTSARTDTWNGKNLREMFRTGTKLLDRNALAINALNVFPVPDGDTGTNMLLTMQSAMAEANLCPDGDAAAVAQAMARGALMGARGNSGVILSQVLRGFAEGLGGRKSFCGPDIAEALAKASQAAYRAMSQPTEGTMLTVIREAAEVARATCAECSDLESIIEAAVKEAKESVSRTPDLLPVLKESGVVDAGGHGLAVIMEGLLLYLKGVEAPPDESKPESRQPAAVMPRTGVAATVYGYCTEFLIHGDALDLDDVRASLSPMGDSLLVVGDSKMVRVHVHTFDPGAVISCGTSMGTLRQIKIDNMEDQHQEFISSQAPKAPEYVARVSTVAVASGDGLARIFGSLGATCVIPGGETMNPSVQELLRAVESVPSDRVIILPNNPNIAAAAHQVETLTKKKVNVVATRTIPQGITALMAFNPEAELEPNLQAMNSSIAAVRTGEIAIAARSMQYKNLRVKKGQVIGLVDEELVECGYSVEEVLPRLLAKMEAAQGEILTVYYGGDVDWADAEKLFDSVRPLYPELEIEVVSGCQPHYDYIISVE